METIIPWKELTALAENGLIVSRGTRVIVAPHEASAPPQRQNFRANDTG